MRDEILDAARELLSRMTLPELVELMRQIVDEIEIRMMQNAQ